MSEDEDKRVASLLEAQCHAEALFAEVERLKVLAPGVSEQEASDRIRDLAAERFEVADHWHKRIVRAGPNTLQVYRQDPPDRLIESDDIVFCDFGPVFSKWEADFGRTFVMGEDPEKLRLRDALSPLFEAGRALFESQPDVNGEQLYAQMVRLAHRDGWLFGGEIAGHLVGQFPHESIEGERVESYIAPGNTYPLRRVDRSGHICHWILEVHLVDRDRTFGGFYEQLLDL